MVQMRTDNPVWEQGFNFLVANPESDTLRLTVLDNKTGNELGCLTYNVRNLGGQERLAVDRQPFGLMKSGPESKITLAMYLRVSWLLSLFF